MLVSAEYHWDQYLYSTYAGAFCFVTINACPSRIPLGPMSVFNIHRCLDLFRYQYKEVYSVI